MHDPGAPACPATAAPTPTSTSGLVPASAHIPGTPGPDVSISGFAPGSSTTAAPVSVAPAPRRTRLQDGIRKPKQYTHGTIRYAYSASSGEPYNL
jgi:hypothetical protein